MNFLTDGFEVAAGQFDGPVLVTGAGGCIGAWTLAILSASGVSAVAFDLSDNRRRPGLIMGPEAADALTWETGDISDAAGLMDIINRHHIRAIIHLAGLQVPFCAANPALGARVNVEGTINIFQAAREAEIKRTVYASSTAVYGMPPGGDYLETIYGAYKLANEYTAHVYWKDWQIPTVGIRPNVVYGIGRDQGISSKCTAAVQAAVEGQPYEVPWVGPTSFLYAGEAASAFIAAAAQDGHGAPVFDLNGRCETVEHCLDIIRELQPGARISATGAKFPIPPDLDDRPIQAHVGGYETVSVEKGLADTHRAFVQLQSEGRLDPLPS